ncbi:hypothetical protein A1l_00001 [Klebsiella phage VLCpiA1l]|nr:hypothetical protein A1l_00001 [Klebsiella phage VLCpiA1l]
MHVNVTVEAFDITPLDQLLRQMQELHILGVYVTLYERRAAGKFDVEILPLRLTDKQHRSLCRQRGVQANIGGAGPSEGSSLSTI